MGLKFAVYYFLTLMKRSLFLIIEYFFQSMVNEEVPAWLRKAFIEKKEKRKQTITTRRRRKDGGRDFWKDWQKPTGNIRHQTARIEA